MTSAPGWYGPPLDDDHRELRSMLDAFLEAKNVALQDDTEVVAALVRELAELGVWTLGTAEAAGGGGADLLMTMLAFERLGRRWPALAWASVQTHAAVDVLAGRAEFTTLISQLHAGTAAVSVVDARSVHVRLSRNGTNVSGSVARVDAAAEQPHLLILLDNDSALLVEPPGLITAPLRRTGLGGALTRALTVKADTATSHSLSGVDTAAALVRLRQGAAAVAAGIAGAAADAALEYASGRRQFGGPLTALPTVRQSLLGQRASAAVALNAATGAVADPVQAYAIQRAACDGAIDTAAAALQSHGGYGYLVEYPAERYLRDAVSFRAAVDTWSAATHSAAAMVGLVEDIPAVRDAS